MSDPILIVPGITDPSTLACLARARKFKQYVRAVKNTLEGICPFCNVDREYNEIIAENNSWYAWKCNPPENHTKFHILYVSKQHVTSSLDLPTNAWVALAEIRRIVQHILEYTSSGFLMRDGDATLSAGTIQHLHAHEMVPDGTGRVESPFYKGRESELKGIRRAIVFEKIRQNPHYAYALSPEEEHLVDGRL